MTPKASGSIDSCTFGAWLSECGEGLPKMPNSRKNWSRRVAEFLPGDDMERVLRRYASNGVRPRPAAAYDIGWALGDAGIAWCSAPISLAAAGHYGHFFRLLSMIAASGVSGRTIALKFALAFSPVCVPMMLANRVSEEVWNRHGFSSEQGEIRARAIADRNGKRIERREYAESVLAGFRDSARVAIDAGWERVQAGRSHVDADANYENAAKIANVSEISLNVRIKCALEIIVDGAVRGSDEERSLVSQLGWLSPVQEQ